MQPIRSAFSGQYVRKTIFATTFLVTGIFLVLCVSNESVMWRTVTWRTASYTGSKLWESSTMTKPPITEEQDERRSQINRVCKRYNLSQPLPKDDQKLLRLVNNAQLYYSDEYKVIGCWIPKVGSTNFKKLFAVVEGLSEKGNPMEIRTRDALALGREQLRLKSLKNAAEIRYRLENYYKMITVRDPARRVLSAFTSKIGKPTSAKYFQNWAQKIHKTYSDDDSPIAFEEFVHYVTNSSNSDDVHWRFFYNICMPCTIQYDYVSKLESATEDINRFMKIVGMTDISFPQKKSWAKSTKEDKFKTYFKGKPDLLSAIYKAYRLDYDLFGYSHKYSFNN